MHRAHRVNKAQIYRGRSIGAGAIGGPEINSLHANRASGDLVALVPSGCQEHLLFLMVTTSGAPLSETSTYLKASLASLGLTPGAYVYNWGSGDHADSFTIDVVRARPPSPSRRPGR